MIEAPVFEKGYPSYQAVNNKEIIMQDGPMKQHIDRDNNGLLKAEYTTYTVKDGRLVKETSVRQYRGDGDYNDSFYSEPLVEVK